ncbi:PspC domain-containing protein [Arenibacter algicola]|uniref:PspC domain protein n=1 Tax=Arenibacter algicola TaxID=616991 RepID=A0A221UZK8_9FLAO|nr:PspC domain-containing protein [Arenibacter algicola]ASO06782.1 PspC domain protein [Arenibacter algicola]
MDTHNISAFFTRPNKSILGVCSTLSEKWSISPFALRIALIILTLIIIPLGIITYIIIYLLIYPTKNKTFTFAITGMVLGIPLSYFFQSNMVKKYGGDSGIINYLRNFTSIVDEYDAYIGSGWDIIYNVLLSIIVFTLIGGTLGYLSIRGKQNKE